MSILSDFFLKSQFFIKIIKKFRFVSKLSKIFDFCQIFRKISILAKILKNFGVGLDFFDLGLDDKKSRF